MDLGAKRKSDVVLQTLILATALLSEGTIHGVVRAAETHEPIAHAVDDSPRSIARSEPTRTVTS